MKNELKNLFTGLNNYENICVFCQHNFLNPSLYPNLSVRYNPFRELLPTYGKMVQNLLWETGYNAIALPLAAGVLYNFGIILTPALGAVFMSLSTIICAINAKLLKEK